MPKYSTTTYYQEYGAYSVLMVVAAVVWAIIIIAFTLCLPGILLKSGQLAKMSIFTPHECIKQTKSGNRQFIRIVGEGVEGREDYFTLNPLI